VAAVVVRRPGTVLLVMAVVLAWPAWRGWRSGCRYDAFGVVSASSSAARGRALAERHFTAAELFVIDKPEQKEAPKVSFS
jgi:hypothetical protein